MFEVVQHYVSGDNRLLKVVLWDDKYNIVGKINVDKVDELDTQNTLQVRFADLTAEVAFALYMELAQVILNSCK